MKNSDFRQFANATQVEPSASPLRYVLMAVAVAVPAFGMYAYKSGMIFGPKYVAVAPAPQKAAIAAVPAPAASAATPAPATPAPFAPPPAQNNSFSGTFSSSGAPAPGGATGAKPVSSADMAKSLNMALRIQMNMGLMFEMIADQIDDIGGSRREITSDRIIDYCKVQARRRLDDQGYGRNGRKASESFMFDVMAERIYCMMTRRPEKLCEPPVKAEVLRQYGNYLKIKDGALKELTGSSGMEAGAPLKAGVHRAIHDELRKLGTRGYLSINDFGWFPHEDVKMAIGDLKVAKPACKG